MLNILVGEIIGTAVLILIGTSTCAAVSLNKSPAKGDGWVFITFGWGLGVLAGIIVSMPISGAVLNPAVAFGLFVTSSISFIELIVYIIAEMIGALIGAYLTYQLYYNHFAQTTDSHTIFSVFATSPSIKDSKRNLLSEIVGTFILVLFILMCSLDSSLGAIYVPLVVIAIGIALGSLTGYAINPARDLGPRIIHYLVKIEHKGPSNWQYAWIPIVGPLTGGLLAGLLFIVLEKIV